MNKQKRISIILFKPLPNAGRFKLHIPFLMTAERKILKALNTSFYHPQQKLWSLVNSNENWTLVSELFKGKYVVNHQQPTQSLPKVVLNENALNALAETEKTMTLKAFSHNTVKAYRNELIYFFKYFENRNYSDVNKAEIENYVFMLIKKYKISLTKQNQLINAIKCYYEHVLKKDRTFYNIQRPNKESKLPNVLSKLDIEKLLNSPNNLKHQTMLSTIYSAGLRISELLNLRIEDIDSKQGHIFVKAAKGKKDRYTVLSPILLKLLRKYYLQYKPSYWLFEGQEGGKYSASSVQKVLRKAVKATNVSAWTTPHTLRHSLATHLMQDGLNMRIIQKLLGHNSSKTTEIYTHVLNINNKTVQSPLDGLYLNMKINNNKQNNKKANDNSAAK